MYILNTDDVLGIFDKSYSISTAKYSPLAGPPECLKVDGAMILDFIKSTLRDVLKT